MLTLTYRSITLAVVASLLLALALVAPVGATTVIPGTGRDTAGAPQADWVTLQPGQTNWYKFHYDYDDSDNPPVALVVVKMEMAGGVSFSVETPGSLAQPREDEDGHLRQPLGVGAPMSLKLTRDGATDKEFKLEQRNVDEHNMIQDPMALIWAGSAKASDTYYVVVKNNHDHPCAYKISITGKTVGF